MTLDDAFTSLIGKFSGGSSPARVSNSLSLFFNIRNSITAASGTLSSIFVNYFKSVSALLEMIISIKECYIEMHLEAKRYLVPQLFAFGRWSCGVYPTCQHALLEVHRIRKTSLWKDLRENIFGGSLTGDTFLQSMDILSYYWNHSKQGIKVREGMMQGGCSTDLDPTNIFVKNSHLLTKLRSVLKECIHLLYFFEI